MQALGGAKNHAIVLPDADIENTVSSLMGAAYGSCGERCMAISVVVCVGDETAVKVIEGIRQQATELRVGNGTNLDSQMGPLVSRAHYEKVRGYVDLGVEEGAELLVDGRGLVVEGHEDGFFLGPCLFDGVTELLTKLAEDHTLALLSNTNPVHWNRDDIRPVLLHYDASGARRTGEFPFDGAGRLARAC